ncbi:hypothetical protein C8R45DRAFT_1049581 [Mycena sanguinolenta]|nr:hypothetical protein C8R45DRAFT_1049581 [Mycena sanguinolenta]
MSLFDVQHQLTFYGAYHSNRINVIIHVICVPLLLCPSGLVMGTKIPVPSFVPTIHHQFSDYLVFELNGPAIYAAICLAYYFVLEPMAALLYTPQVILSLLSATAFARGASHITQATILHALCWVAQFIGHGVAEKRAPALLDNLIQAVVLAPFFVHLEVLFALGYRPQMHKELKNEIGKEITQIRKAEGDKRRAAAAKAN